MRARRLLPLRVGGLGVSSSTEAVCGAAAAAASSLTVLSGKKIVKRTWHLLCSTKNFGGLSTLKDTRYAMLKGLETLSLSARRGASCVTHRIVETSLFEKT